MHAMQYEITLPADYDMGIVRDRVARRGHLLDNWPGLGAKAYLVRERGVHGSPVNAYAPFYLWNTGEGMNAFLWGGAFQGVADDFGRPAVRQWSGLAVEDGPAVGSPAALAVRRREPVPDGVVLSEVTAGGRGGGGPAGPRGRRAARGGCRGHPELGTPVVLPVGARRAEGGGGRVPGAASVGAGAGGTAAGAAVVSAARPVPGGARSREPGGRRRCQPTWSLSLSSPQPCQRSISIQALTRARSRRP
ncbi:hypothetical protein GCM10020256_69460 [Streptomyces thermocoprophilus]